MKVSAQQLTSNNLLIGRVSRTCRAARFCFAAAHGGQVMMPLELAQEVVASWTGAQHSLQLDAEAQPSPAVLQAYVLAAGSNQEHIASWVPSLSHQGRLQSSSSNDAPLQGELSGIEHSRRSGAVPV